MSMWSTSADRTSDPSGGAEGSPLGLILLYHRVTEISTDPQLLCVSPTHFTEHLEILARVARPVSLRDIQQEHPTASSAPAVAITFDDGYADNLLQAAPILQRHGVPATFFVVAHAVDSGKEFWWDELDQLLLQPNTLPSSLHVKVSGLAGEWSLGEVATYSQEVWRRFSGWNVLQPPPTPRHATYLELSRRLRPLPFASRNEALEQLFIQAGLTRAARAEHRAVNAQEIINLPTDDLMDIGAHTMTHSQLGALAPDKQRAEIADGKQRLEEYLGRPVPSFSYPYGTRHDYTADTVQLAREAGFELACSNFAGVVKKTTDRFQLPRMLVRDWDGNEFERRLREA